MAVMTASGVATPRGVAKPRIDKLKFERIFKYQASLRWGFFVSAISPRIHRAFQTRVFQKAESENCRYKVATFSRAAFW